MYIIKTIYTMYLCGRVQPVQFDLIVWSTCTNVRLAHKLAWIQNIIKQNNDYFTLFCFVLVDLSVSLTFVLSKFFTKFDSFEVKSAPGDCNPIPRLILLLTRNKLRIKISIVIDYANDHIWSRNIIWKITH